MSPGFPSQSQQDMVSGTKLAADPGKPNSAQEPRRRGTAQLSGWADPSLAQPGRSLTQDDFVRQEALLVQSRAKAQAFHPCYCQPHPGQSMGRARLFASVMLRTYLLTLFKGVQEDIIWVMDGELRCSLTCQYYIKKHKAEDISDLGSLTTPNDNVRASSLLLLVRVPYIALLNSK